MSDRYFSESDVSAERRVADWNSFSFYNTDSSAGDIANAGPVGVTIAGQEAVDRAKKLLSGIQGGVGKALNSAIRSAGRTLRANSTRVIRERYDITAGNIRTERNITVNYRQGTGVQATVRFAGKRIPLIRFGGASPQVPTPDTSRRFPVPVPVGYGGLEMRLVHPGIPARGHVLKSTSPTQFQTAFTARMKSQTGTSHIGIFERTGGVTGTRLQGGRLLWGVDELRELFGPSVAQMVGNQEVAQKLVENAYRAFETELDKAVYRILAGWR